MIWTSHLFTHPVSNHGDDDRSDTLCSDFEKCVGGTILRFGLLKIITILRDAMLTCNYYGEIL